jgi:hypothetical protein
MSSMKRCLLGALLSWPLAVVLVSTPVWTQDRNKGVIEGRVTNEMGKPIANAKVHADLVGVRPQATLYRFEETDGNGHFSIDQLDWGEYVVGAMKKEDGYAYQLNRLYMTGPPPHATLTPQQPTANLEIQFTAKAALLVGRLTDATTGAPLQATFKLSRKPDSPTENYLTGQPSDYRVLLPPDVDTYIEVSAWRGKRFQEEPAAPWPGPKHESRHCTRTGDLVPATKNAVKMRDTAWCRIRRFLRVRV